MNITDFQKLKARDVGLILMDLGGELQEFNNNVFKLINDKDKQHALKRIILWDSFFDPNKDKFDIDAFRGGISIKEFQTSIRDIYFNHEVPISYISEQIKKAIVRWPKMRDFIFEADKNNLNQCVTEEDLNQYIRGEHYLEFVLYAKYKLSQQTNTPFEEVGQALDFFPQSDILPIEELNNLLHTVPNGISFLFSGEASNEESVNLRNCITSFVSNFERKCDNNYILKNPVTYAFLREIVASISRDNEQRFPLDYELYLHDNQLRKRPDDTPIIAGIGFFKSLCDILNSMLGRCNIELSDYPNMDKLFTSYTFVITTK